MNIGGGVHLYNIFIYYLSVPHWLRDDDCATFHMWASDLSVRTQAGVSSAPDRQRRGELESLAFKLPPLISVAGLHCSKLSNFVETY